MKDVAYVIYAALCKNLTIEIFYFFKIKEARFTFKISEYASIPPSSLLIQYKNVHHFCIH